MADVFISYARPDKAKAGRLARALETEGLDVWWDRDLIGGEDFDSRIRQEIGAADLVLVLWSEASVQSDYVRGEATLARQTSALVSVTLDASPLPIEFLALHAVALDGWFNSDDPAGFREVLKTVSARRRDTPSVPAPVTASDKSRLQIRYDYSWAGQARTIELPFVVGVLANFSGPAGHRARFRDRQWIDIDLQSFDEVLHRVGPRILISLPHPVLEPSDPLELDLTLDSLSAFRPDGLLARIPRLRQFAAHRDQIEPDAGLAEVRAVTGMDIDEGQIRVGSASECRGKALFDLIVPTTITPVLRHPEFKSLEARWLGLLHLLERSPGDGSVLVRLLNGSREEVQTDLLKEVDLDHSTLFQRVYEDDYGTIGGEPLSILVTEWELGRDPADVALVRLAGEVCEAANVCLLAAAHPSLFGFSTFQDLGRPRDISRVFAAPELEGWNELRGHGAAGHVFLTLPRILMRRPYSGRLATNGIEFQESPPGSSADLCWGSAAFSLAACAARAVGRYGWCPPIAGSMEIGSVTGLVRLPNPDDPTGVIGPTEVPIPIRLERQLSNLGFVPMLQARRSTEAAFIAARCLRKRKWYDSDAANANEDISMQFHGLLISSRFLATIKQILLQRSLSLETTEQHLRDWVNTYVDPADGIEWLDRVDRPLLEARLDVIRKEGDMTISAFFKTVR